MIREVTITPVLNGFVCKVGCQTVVFKTTTEMAQELKLYYDRPDDVEKQYLKEAVNKMSDMPQTRDGLCNVVAESPRREPRVCVDSTTQLHP